MTLPRTTTCDDIAERMPAARGGRFRVSAVTLSAAVAALHCWLYRHQLVNLDAVSYLEIARDYAHGDFAGALNGYWSPLYSWVLALAWVMVDPSPAREYLMLHVVN